MYMVAITRSLHEGQGFFHPNDIIYSTSCKKNIIHYLKNTEFNYPIKIFKVDEVEIDFFKEEENENDN